MVTPVERPQRLMPSRRRQRDLIGRWLVEHGRITEAQYRRHFGWPKALSAIILDLIGEDWDIRTHVDGRQGYTLIQAPGQDVTRPTMFGPDYAGKRAPTPKMLGLDDDEDDE